MQGRTEDILALRCLIRTSAALIRTRLALLGLRGRVGRQICRGVRLGTDHDGKHQRSEREP